MTSLKSLILCFLVTSSVWYTANTNTDITVGQLPKDIIENIFSILVWGTVLVIGDCKSANDTSAVEYWLYTRNNPSEAIIINSYDQIDASKPVIFLIHGWGGYADVDYIHVIKEAYLKRYDCNIISVNYQKYAAYNYQTAYCYIPGVGRNIAQFICNMSSKLKINLSDLHVVGHSLGGQTAGFVGKNIRKMCGTLGRITALDPAGPLYQYLDKDHRIDESDATFVQTIHTNQGQFGYDGICAHVDFYPDCGYFQSGCEKLIFAENSTIKDILNLPLSLVRCNHQRSCNLFAESINNNSFHSTSCLFCGTPFCLKTPPLIQTHAYMGESCRSKPKSREYLLETNDKPPHGKGPVDPLD